MKTIVKTAVIIVALVAASLVITYHSGFWGFAKNQPQLGQTARPKTLKKSALGGRAFPKVMESADSGDMDAVVRLTVYYGTDFPYCDEVLYWIKRAAGFGDEYLQDVLVLMHTLEYLKQGRETWKSKMNYEAFESRDFVEVMDSAFAGDMDSIKRLITYYEVNYSDREEEVYWREKLAEKKMLP